MILYKEHTIWSKIRDGMAFKYICFEDLSTGNFCVQSKDVYYSDYKTSGYDFDRQKIELFLEQNPFERENSPNGPYKTLSAAIEGFERDFGRYAETIASEQNEENTPRNAVMSAYQSSHEKFAALYEKLAE